jgi:hypothetical protein
MDIQERMIKVEILKEKKKEIIKEMINKEYESKLDSKFQLCSERNKKELQRKLNIITEMMNEITRTIEK